MGREGVGDGEEVALDRPGRWRHNWCGGTALEVHDETAPSHSGHACHSDGLAGGDEYGVWVACGDGVFVRGFGGSSLACVGYDNDVNIVVEKDKLQCVGW